MSDIKARFRREERYEGLQLVFGSSLDDRQKILDEVERLKKVHGVDPTIVENCNSDTAKCAWYIEFNDDYFRAAGPFFEELIKALDIKDCE